MIFMQATAFLLAVSARLGAAAEVEPHLRASDPTSGLQPDRVKAITHSNSDAKFSLQDAKLGAMDSMTPEPMLGDEISELNDANKAHLTKLGAAKEAEVVDLSNLKAENEELVQSDPNDASGELPGACFIPRFFGGGCNPGRSCRFPNSQVCTNPACNFLPRLPQRANGCGCTFDLDCQSRRCSTFSSRCEARLSNGGLCAFDDDCQSGRCSGRTGIDLIGRCEDRLQQGDSCNVLNTVPGNDDCDTDAGLECATPVFQCFHKSRQIGEPCNQLTNNCAENSLCLPIPQGDALVPVWPTCVGASQCLLDRLIDAVDVSPVEAIFAGVRSLLQGEIAGFRGSRDSMIDMLRRVAMPALNDMDPSSLSRMATSAMEAVQGCGSQANDSTFGVSEEAARACCPRPPCDCATVFALGIEVDINFVFGFSVQVGFAFSFDGNFFDPAEVRPFVSLGLQGCIAIGIESSIGVFATLQFGGGFNKFGGDSIQLLGVDVAVPATFVGGGIAFGHTLSNGFIMNDDGIDFDESIQQFDETWAVTINFGAGVGITPVTAMLACGVETFIDTSGPPPRGDV